MGLEGRWLQAVTSALTICMLSVSQGEASLVNARQGESAELSCNVSPDSKERTTSNLFPLHVVEWVRLGFTVPILIKFGVYTPRIHPNYKGRVSLTPDASLLVERLTLEDEGWFECRILVLDTEKDDFKNGTWTFLSITAPPVFIKTPPTIVEVLLGDSLTLSCGAHGNPRPTIVWHKDDSQIEKHEKIKVVNGTLSLASVTRNISGVYKCHVSNLEGNLTHSTQLQVKGPPIIIISPEDTTLNMSQDAVLQCQADAYPSNLTYEWLKQGQNVYHIDSLRSRVKILVDGTLLIPNLIPDDAGNYTCIPTNGILTPPSASAHLTVKHPARVGRMPRETYLPTGLEGVIVCPVQADPPVLYVNWTKDGNNLNLDKYPGWLINSEGSVFITATTDNAVGMYTCTAYNSYGTMGQSEPTQVILQDPPSFRVLPRPEYLQEVGRELMIPCEGSGEPSPTITWSKIGPSPRSQYTVLTNGSLLLKPVNKDHHGGWECLATNRVATVSAGTVVMVLGTSPHAVSSVSVTTEMNQANISWVPGFDGGYTQKYTVWVKQASRGKHEWASLPVPTSKNYLLVTGLLAGTTYQFSVLPQNKVGSGPFSEIVSVRMQAVPTEKPTALPFVPVLDPPILLSANQTENGVLLQWSPPEAPAFPLTGYVLQARRDQSQWVILSSSINANQTELLVQGLLRNCNYGLRLMSHSHTVLSEPSESVNVSTFGIEIYPLSSTFLEDILPPLLAGVIAGVCFLIVAIILSFVTACYMSHRREHRRKRRQYLPSTFQTNLSPTTRSPPHSPDSVLKLKLCPPLPFFPNSSSSQSDQSSFDKGSRGEYHDQRKQLLSHSSPPPHYTPLFESHLGSQGPSPVALESISRGPDGRFIVQPRGEGSSPSNKNKLKEDILQMNGGASGSGSNGTPFRESPKSSILSSEKGERKNSNLTVDVPEHSKLPSSPGRVRAMARNFSRHGCFYSDDEQGTEALLERASFYSDNSEKKPSNSHRRHQVPGHTEALFPKLYRKNKPMERSRPYHSDYHPIESQLTNNSTMISQLDSELERGSINNYIQLAKERKLERYSDQGHGRNNLQSNNRESPKETLKSEEEPVWKLQDVTMRQKHMLSGQTGQASYSRRACYFGDTSSPLDRFPKSCIQWDISPVTSVTKLVPVQSPQETRSPKSQHPQTYRETSEDSLVVDLSCSQVTQNTSLRMLSTATTSEGSTPAPSVQNTESVRFLTSQTVVEQDSRERTLDGGFQPRSRFSYAGSQPLTSTTKGVSVYSESPGISDCASYNLCERTTIADYSATRDPSPSVFSALPCDHHEVGAKAKEKQTRDDGHSSGFCSYLEKEGVRTQSRRSDKCLFSDCSSPISTLTLVEGADNDQSQFSVPEMAKARGPSSKMSPLQTSAILEYLSLPGFIEMSVDEPVEDAEVTNTTEQSSEPKSEKSPGTKPDVVLKNWQAHGQENQEMASIPNSFFEQTHSASPVESRFYSNPKQIYKRSLPGNRKDSTLRVRFTNEIRPSSTGLEKTSKQLYDEKKQIWAVRTNSDIAGSRSAHTFFSAAKGVADIVSKHSQSCGSNSQSLLEQSQRHASQGSRTNNIASRICQAPVPFLKKSLSVGPCRTLSSMVDPHPFLKKSLSLGSQKLEHFESPRVYISEKCYWDELPNPDFKSDGLRRTPSSSPRPGPSWREYIPFRRPIRSAASLERLGHTQRSLASPSYLSSPMYPPRQTSVSPLLEPADPQRQATVFLESPRWSPSYQDMLRSAQHKYIPMPSAIHVPQYHHWPGPRGESMRPMDPRRGPPRSYIPRGISWPTTHYPPVPAGEGESYRLPDRITARGGDADIQEGRRSSYTSQSSGRGSAGLFRQSLSITPTLLSSPETTECERHRAEMELPERRANRRNTSVDESYEWDSADACVDAEVLDAMRFDQSHSNGFQRGRVELRRDQAPGLQDHQQKGLPPSLSPPVSKPPRYQYSCSLSEVHFNSLRQEYQEYRRAQASMRSCEPCLTTGNGSDSDSNSALL